MKCLNFLFLYILFVNLVFGDVNIETISNEFLQLSENASGAIIFKEKLQTLKFQNDSVTSGPELAKVLAQNVENKMVSRGTAVDRLVRAAYKTYINSNWGNLEECCRFSFVMDKYDENLCTRISKYARQQHELPSLAFLEAAKLNLKEFPGLKGQYFGSETGILTQYPAQISNDCINYDPRFRPWYVQASTAAAKDIVLVIDRSASMIDNKRIEAAIHAGTTIISSLSPNDRVSVVVFSDKAEILGTSLTNIDTRHYVSGDESNENCFETTMAQATPGNIKRLTTALKEVRPYGETQYQKALDLAFTLLRTAFEADVSKTCKYSNSAVNATAVAYSRHRSILFLSDGEPSDRPSDILRLIHDNNRRIHNSVVLLCYALGSETFGNLLHKMSIQYREFGDKTCQNMEYDSHKTCNSSPYNFCALAKPRTGVYEHVVDSEYLRSAMGSYYSYFAHSDSIGAYQHIGESSTNRPTSMSNKNLGLFNATWSVPYFDAFGLGMVVTAASPLVIGDVLIGVVGVDLTLDELMADATYFHSDGLSTYAFLMDKTGRVLLHPYIPTPSATEKESILTDIEAFERSEEVQIFLYSVLNTKHENGKFDVKSETMKTYRVLPHTQRSVTTVQAELTYNCVNLESVIVCVVVQHTIEMLRTLQPPVPPANYTVLYHRLDLYETGSECNYDGQHSTGIQSVIMLSPMCFIDPGEYLATMETENSVESLMYYLAVNDSDFKDIRLKQGIRNSVLLSHILDAIWRNNRDEDGHILWRYFATTDGVFRISPGIQLPKDYNPVHRPWYKQARTLLFDHIFNLNGMNCTAQGGCNETAAVTPPYVDATGAGVIVTISQAITAGDDDMHRSMIGVIGMDVKLEYIHTIIGKSVPACKDEFSWTECLLIDTSGYVIFDSTLLQHPNLIRNGEYHIMRSRPSMARELIENDILKRQQCVDVARVLYRDEYRVQLDQLHSSSVKLSFEAKYIAKTNMVLLVSKKTRQNFKDCHMHDGYISPCLVAPYSRCEHPCANYDADQHYQMCSNVYNYTWHDDPPPCLPDKFIEEVQFDQVIVNDNPQTQDYSALPNCS